MGETAAGEHAATVVLVHGAFHDPWCWEAVRTGLDARGVLNLAPELPFTGLGADADTVRAVLDAVDGPVVLCGHSYGGMVISEAASGRTDVARLVYLCAVQVADNAEMSASFRPTPFMASLRPDGTGISVDPEIAGPCFYHDCDPALAATATARLRAMAVGPGAAAADADASAEPTRAAWLDIPSTYVVCTSDQVVHPETQREMAQNATDVVEWDTSHSPMLSRPDLVVDLLAGLAATINSNTGAVR